MRGRWLVTVGIIAVLAVGVIGSLRVVGRTRAEAPDGTLVVSGRIEGEEVLISSKVGGRVTAVRVGEGDRVTRGQLIATLSSEELDARLRQADAQVDAARAQVGRAQGEADVLERQVAQVRAALLFARTQAAAQQRQAQAALATALARQSQARTALAIGETQSSATASEARAALRAAEAELARARTLQDQAARDLSRMQALQISGAVAVADVDAARTRLDVAAGQVTLAGEQVQRTRASLARAETGSLEVAVREDDVTVAAAQVEMAGAQMDAAGASAFDLRRLAEQVFAMERQRQIAGSALEAARAQLRGATAGRDELRMAVQEAKVYAPVSGVVTTRVVNAGEVVPPGTPLVTVVNLQAIWLKVFIPERDLGRLRLGMRAQVRVDAFAGRSFSARLVEISQRAQFTPKDVQTREERVRQVFAVKLAVDNPDEMLKPGMPADAWIIWKGSAP